MANALYDYCRQRFLEANINWLTDTIKCILVDTGAYTPNLTTHQYLSDISGSARIAGPVTLSSKATTGGAAALGSIAFALGKNSLATNANDMAFGTGATTSGSSSSNAIAMGTNSKTTQVREYSWATGDSNFLSNQLQMSVVATSANTNYYLGGFQQAYNQIPVAANGTTTFSGIVTVKQKNANGQNMMAWKVEGIAWETPMELTLL